MKTFKEKVKAINEAKVETWNSSNDSVKQELKDAYYSLSEAMTQMKNTLSQNKELSYMSVEFNKILKIFNKFDDNNTLGKHL